MTARVFSRSRGQAVRVGRSSQHPDKQPAHAAGSPLRAPSRRISSERKRRPLQAAHRACAQKTLRSASGRRKIRQPQRPGRSQPSRAKSTNHGGGAPVAANHARDCLCSFLLPPHATEQESRCVASFTCLHSGSMVIRTTANRKTATAKANATTRTLRCSNFPEALAKKSTVANKTVFARYCPETLLALREACRLVAALAVASAASRVPRTS